MIREINAAGLTLIQDFEGLKDGDTTTPNYDPYPDLVGIWTIGFGHAIRHPQTGKFLRGDADRLLAFSLFPGGLSRAQCDALLVADLIPRCAEVSRCTKGVTVTDNQFAALVSFEFNTGGLARSTLLVKLLAGDVKGAAGEFKRWNKANGRAVAGLTRRREAERALFLS